jgi:preprotein translocase, secE subunit
VKLFNFFGEVKEEMQKTTWPSGKELRKDSATIFGVIIFFSIFFYVSDIVLNFLLNLI